MSGEAEFKNAVIEFDVGSRGGSDVGLHFYNGDEDTTIFSASTDELDRGEFICNPILMSLVSDKIKKLKNQKRK